MIKNIYQGKFIVLEGLDGAGKSTQASLVANYLREKSFVVCQTSEPTQFLVGGLVRACLLGQWQGSPECLQLLFAADREDHLKKEIIPCLKKGNIVVSDRYFISSLAYGAADCDKEWLIGLNSHFLIPDITIYLDVSPQICARRIIDAAKSIELFEKVEILEVVSQNYKQTIELFADKMKIAIIDGNRTVEDVFADIINEIN